MHPITPFNVTLKKLLSPSINITKACKNFKTLNSNYCHVMNQAFLNLYIHDKFHDKEHQHVNSLFPIRIDGYAQRYILFWTNQYTALYFLPSKAPIVKLLCNYLNVHSLKELDVRGSQLIQGYARNGTNGFFFVADTRIPLFYNLFDANFVGASCFFGYLSFYTPFVKPSLLRFTKVIRHINRMYVLSPKNIIKNTSDKNNHNNANVVSTQIMLCVHYYDTIAHLQRVNKALQAKLKVAKKSHREFLKSLRLEIKEIKYALKHYHFHHKYRVQYKKYLKEALHSYKTFKLVHKATYDERKRRENNDDEDY